MGMELRVTMELSDGDRYPNETSVTRRFEVNLPWAPGNHNAETALVEAISSIVNFGEVIGELHEELTAKYDEKLHKKAADEAEKTRMAEEFGKPTEPENTDEPEKSGEPAEPGEPAPESVNQDDTEVPQ